MCFPLRLGAPLEPNVRHGALHMRTTTEHGWVIGRTDASGRTTYFARNPARDVDSPLEAWLCHSWTGVRWRLAEADKNDPGRRYFALEITRTAKD